MAKTFHFISASNYFDHQADIGIIGYGKTVETAFINAAQSMFAFMCEDFIVKKKEKVSFTFEEIDLEIAFVKWLNYLLGCAQEKNLILGYFFLERIKNSWKGSAMGEPWSKTMKRGTEVKGATVTMLSVSCKNEIWEARCVLDV